MKSPKSCSEKNTLHNSTLYTNCNLVGRIQFSMLNTSSKKKSKCYATFNIGKWRIQNRKIELRLFFQTLSCLMPVMGYMCDLQVSQSTSPTWTFHSNISIKVKSFSHSLLKHPCYCVCIPWAAARNTHVKWSNSIHYIFNYIKEMMMTMYTCI